MVIQLCSLCFDNLNFPGDAAMQLPDGQHCSFCFGLLNDASVCEDIVAKAKEQLKLNQYDGGTFLLALNTPITMHLREVVVDKLLGSAFVPMSMSPKGQFSTYLMSKIGQLEAIMVWKRVLSNALVGLGILQATGLRPTLNSDLVLTVTISNNEFMDSDMTYFRSYFSKTLNSGKKRRSAEAEISTLFTKVKVNTAAEIMDESAARRYNMECPTRKCQISVNLERDATFVGGRYCKYSRSLPQSPWSPDMETARVTNNSMKNFRADSYRFIASGREDIDVRMLGVGRPFAIQLINARSVVPLNLSAAKEVLDPLLAKINEDSLDIKVNSLARVTTKEMVILNVGQEEKRKTYSCICHSNVLLTDGMMEKLGTIAPVEISQKTVIRVLKRRPLIDRKRTIFAMKAAKTANSGGYICKGGRTRPSVSALMGLKLGDVDILELDVESVDLEWPPQKKS